MLVHCLYCASALQTSWIKRQKAESNHRAYLLFAILVLIPFSISAQIVFAADNSDNSKTASSAKYQSKTAGPFAVETLLSDWHDDKRNRDVPVKIYYPKRDESSSAATALCPIVIFSHGLGGSRNGYEYLGRYWAGYGYVSVHLQHPGSDTSAWQGKAQPMEGMRAAAADIKNLVNRPLDVRFAIDQVEKMNSDETPLKGRLDLKRIGMAGHSFGAYTTLAAIGQAFVTPQGKEISLSEPRIKAAIAMSSPVPKNKDQFDKAFAKIAIPVMHMTGTLDSSPIGDTKAEERRIPFDHTNGSDQYLLNFEGGDHMIFSGRLRGVFKADTGSGEKDTAFQDKICIASLAFWDAYLENDGNAKNYLMGKGFENVLGALGKFEKKIKEGTIPK
ncbi:MAG: hypothetical protein NTX50_25160 [Candidatus Sumerlaeota bacterium]|nr:hypothetical protein [Candidatus Sumerlaeota bacterium]